MKPLSFWINHQGFQNHQRGLLGQLVFAGRFSLPKGREWPRFAGELQRERGEKADAGICFPVAPESTDPQGDLKLSQVFPSLVWEFSWKRRSVDML